MSFLDQARAAIRKAGGRMTAQRQLIIALLEDSDGHLDAEGLYRLAYQHDESVSLATVYRTLNTLEAAGLLQQHYLSYEHDRKYYEPLDAEEHYHFTCRNCHRVIEFRSELIDELKRKLEAELNVDVHHVCACFDGLCSDCRDGE